MGSLTLTIQSVTSTKPEVVKLVCDYLCERIFQRNRSLAGLPSRLTDCRTAAELRR